MTSRAALLSWSNLIKCTTAALEREEGKNKPTKNHQPITRQTSLFWFFFLMCMCCFPDPKYFYRIFPLKILGICISLFLYKDFSASNASYFIILAHDIWGGCWWCGSRVWNFPPIFYYVLLLCDRWQQRGTLTEWWLTWKCVWSKGVS